MLENINVNIINGLLVIGGAILVVATGGGIAAFIAYLRQHKAEVERAYQSADPKTQAALLEVIRQGQAALNIANQVILGFSQLIQLGADLTDGDPNTPADPTAMLESQAAKLEAKAKIIRTTALKVQRMNINPPEPPPVPGDRG